MPEEEARYHLKRCIDSGLWVPDARKDAAESAAESGAKQPTEDDETKEETYDEPAH